MKDIFRKESDFFMHMEYMARLYRNGEITYEKLVEEMKSSIDSVNWEIQKIRQATGYRAVSLIECRETDYTWQERPSCLYSDLHQITVAYTDPNGDYYVNGYLRGLRCVFERWGQYVEQFRSLQKRVSGLGLTLDITLFSAELYLPEGFLESRKAYKLKNAVRYYTFCELSLKELEDDLGYLEWKDQAYREANDRERRTELAEQFALLEAWEFPADIT